MTPIYPVSAAARSPETHHPPRSADRPAPAGPAPSTWRFSPPGRPAASSKLPNRARAVYAGTAYPLRRTGTGDV